MRDLLALGFEPFKSTLVEALPSFFRRAVAAVGRVGTTGGAVRGLEVLDVDFHRVGRVRGGAEDRRVSADELAGGATALRTVHCLHLLGLTSLEVWLSGRDLEKGHPLPRMPVRSGEQEEAMWGFVGTEPVRLPASGPAEYSQKKKKKLTHCKTLEPNLDEQHIGGDQRAVRVALAMGASPRRPDRGAARRLHVQQLGFKPIRT